MWVNQKYLPNFTGTITCIVFPDQEGEPWEGSGKGEREVKQTDGCAAQGNGREAGKARAKESEPVQTEAEGAKGQGGCRRAGQNGRVGEIAVA